MIHRGQGPRKDSLLLVGSGRVARHFRFYFESLGLPISFWSRRESVPLSSRLEGTRRVLLAVSDRALPEIIDALPGFEGRLVHFSGAFHDPRAIAAHPLMTFADSLYSIDFYRSIHFAVTGAASLEEAIPGLPNAWTSLPAEKKALYHALCVLGGNFPVLLWNKAEHDLAALGIPAEAARAYFARAAENYSRDGAAALTGPLVRGDTPTIEKNLQALEGDPWRNVYQAFREAMK